MSHVSKPPLRRTASAPPPSRPPQSSPPRRAPKAARQRGPGRAPGKPEAEAKRRVATSPPRPRPRPGAGRPTTKGAAARALGDLGALAGAVIGCLAGLARGGNVAAAARAGAALGRRWGEALAAYLATTFGASPSPRGSRRQPSIPTTNPALGRPTTARAQPRRQEAAAGRRAPETRRDPRAEPPRQPPQPQHPQSQPRRQQPQQQHPRGQLHPSVAANGPSRSQVNTRPSATTRRPHVPASPQAERTLARIARPTTWLSAGDLHLCALMLGKAVDIYFRQPHTDRILFMQAAGVAEADRRHALVLTDNSHWQAYNPASGAITDAGGGGDCGLLALLWAAEGPIGDGQAARRRMVAARSRIASALRDALHRPASDFGADPEAGTLDDVAALADFGEERPPPVPPSP